MNTPLFRALGATLFHFLWEGAVIALVLALCRVSSKVRYRLGCVALAAMPVAFAVTFLVVAPESGARFPFSPDLSWLAAHPAPLDGGQPGSSGTLLERLQESMRWFVPFWFAGMAFFCLRSLAGWFGVVRLRRVGVTIASGHWRHRLHELSNRLGVTRGVTLLESCLVDVPITAGFLRPVILMPAGLLTGMPTAQIEYLLIHELAHIRRFDYVVNLLQMAVEAVLFYHPAVWWVSGVLREEREHCCDEIVIASGADRPAYGAALAELEQVRMQFAPAANGGSLAARVRRILRRPENPGMAGVPLLSVALLTISATITFIALSSPRPVAAQSAMSPYDKWLNEDVVYIITDRERTAFGALHEDEERQQFIEQFWQMHGGERVKEEHYRRIAFTNGRYGVEGISGWKTDRGRIYITFGPPDEIDSHPSDQTPYEDWAYRHIDNLGDNVTVSFRDTDHNGTYHMWKGIPVPGTPVRQFRKK